MAADDLTSLEHRLDKLEAWKEAQEAIEAARAADLTKRHTSFQLSLSVLSGLIMLVNLYLTIHHGK